MQRILLFALGAALVFGLGLWLVWRAPASQLPSLIEPRDFPPQEDGLRRQYRGVMLRQAAPAYLSMTPTDPAAFNLLLEAQMPREALDVLERVVANDFERVGEALHSAALRLGSRPSRLLNPDESREFADHLTCLLASIRQRAAGLSREEAARLVFSLLPLEIDLARGAGSPPEAWTRIREQFVQDYAGTEAALRVQVDARDGGRDRCVTWTRFADEHPGTEAGAMALHRCLEFELQLGGRRRNADPMTVLLSRFQIAERLTSGEFPNSEWVDSAWALALRIWLPDDMRLSDESIELLVSKHLEVMAARLRSASGPIHVPESGADFVRGIRRVYATRDATWEGLATTLDRLETMTDQVDPVRYLRALAYTHRALGYESEVPPDQTVRGLQLLDEFVAENGEYAQHALATVATARFFERDFAGAARDYQAYLDAYPGSDWAWVAGLRLGQALELLGDPTQALAAYKYVLAANKTISYASVLGELYSARALEAEGRYAEALESRDRALARWTPEIGRAIELYTQLRQQRNGSATAVERDYVTHTDTVRRTAQLRWSLGFTRGDTLEAARRLLQGERFEEAIEEVMPLLEGGVEPALAREARSLHAAARFGNALAMADVGSPNPDPGAALELLRLLGDEAWSPAVGGAGLAQAALLGLGGRSDDADAVMQRTLESWIANGQARRAPYEPDIGITGLEHDVASIRNLLFRPLGGGIFSDRRWHGVRFPAQLPPFVIVKPRLTVVLPEGHDMDLWLDVPIPGFDNVVFMPSEDLSMLRDIVRKLTRPETREPPLTAGVPNQPVGDSIAIATLWNRFFPAPSDRWLGWNLATDPRTWRIEFHDAARTRASAGVVVGYGGCTVVLEKIDGEWTVQELTNFWVS